MLALQGEAAWAEERFLGHLWQSVPRNGRVHLHIIEKNVMSIKFPPAILGRKCQAPILWAPGIFWFFLQENPHAHKIPPFVGGLWVCLERGVEVPIIFYGRGDFSEF